MKTYGIKLLLLMLSLLLMLALVGCDDEETPDTVDPDASDHEAQDPPEMPHTHVFGEWQTTAEATCGVAGELTRSCDCGETEKKPILPTGEHRFTVENVCEVCGDRLSYTDGLIYSATDDGAGYVVTGVETTAATEEIIVPPYYESLPVVGVGEGAFASLVTVVRIVLPDSILTIGASAFSNCSALVEVNIPSGVKAIEDETFLGCAALVELVLPEGLLRIGAHAFEGCALLVSLRIPDGVVEIGASAFCGCAALAEIPLPEQITKIPDRCFSGCTSLRTVALPASVTEIGAGAFGGCSLLAEVTWTKLSFVGEGAFEGCAALTLLPHIHSMGFWFESVAATCVLGGEDRRDCSTEGCTYFETKPSPMKDHAYSNGQCLNCPAHVDESTGLLFTLSADETYYILSGLGDCESRDLVIPATYEGLPVKEIAAYAFLVSTGGRAPDPELSLQSLYIPDSIELIGDGAFHSNVALDTVYFGNGVKKIGQNAFTGCGILYLTLPDSLVEIGREAFSSCSIRELDTGDGLTTIGESAFSYCEALYRARIGASVTNVPSSVFSECKKLIEICVAKSITTWVDVKYKHSYLESEGQSWITTDENGFVFFRSNFLEKNRDGEFERVYLLVAYTGEETELTLPTSFDGNRYRVSQYFMSRHPNIKSITSVTIPEGVTVIGESAFAGLSGLRSVSIGPDVDRVGDRSFNSCYALSELVLSEGIQVIATQAFIHCENLKSVTLPAGASVSGGAFSNCYRLVEIYNLSKTTNSYIANNNILSDGEFYVIHSSMDEPSILHTDENGLVFAKREDGTYVLLGYDKEEMVNLYLPETVEGASYTIHPYAFSRNDRIVRVTIPQGIKQIPKYAFFVCKNLIYVSIGRDVDTIGLQAFSSCENLSSVFFADTTTWTVKGSTAIKSSELGDGASAAALIKKHSYEWNKT